MNTIFKTSFLKDVRKSSVELLAAVDEVISEIENSKTLSDISNVKKLKGYKNAYRIKINTYRLCFFYNDDKTLILSRFLPRKDVYRFFP